MILHNWSQLPRRHGYTEHANQEVRVLIQVARVFYLHIYILYILLIHVSHFDVLVLPNILYLIDLTLLLYYHDKHIHEKDK